MMPHLNTRHPKLPNFINSANCPMLHFTVHFEETHASCEIKVIFTCWKCLRNGEQGLWCQNQSSQAGISNCIPQYSVGCNYLSLPEIPPSGANVLKYVFTFRLIPPYRNGTYFEVRPNGRQGLRIGTSLVFWLQHLPWSLGSSTNNALTVLHIIQIMPVH